MKDVLAHLAGWEKEVARELLKTWGSENEAWFMSVSNYDEFNEGIRRFYESYSPDQLIMELEKWQKVLEDEIREIGETNIKNKPDMEWVFDEGGEPHFEHHVKQMKKALNIKL